MSAQLVFLAAVLHGTVQDKPQDIPKANLPKAAPCVVCTSGGAGHGDEKPAAGVAYKGKSYFFCNAKEVPEFKADPEAFMPPVLPRNAPELKAVDTDGKPVTLADYRGRVVLVDFWATWCAPCVKAMPGLDKLAAKRKDQGFSVLGISIDEEPKKVAPFLAKRPVGYRIALDDPKSPTWSAYKVRAVPAMFLIGKNGQILSQWKGEVSLKTIEAEVEKALAQP